MKQMVTLGLSLGLATAIVSLGAHAQAQKEDTASKRFIQTAIEGNNAEIELGKLALNKGQSNAVKQFAQTLVTDYQKANEEAKTAANAVGVKPPDADLVTIGTSVKLKAQSGNAFDRSFIDAMVSDHQKDIKEYQEQSGKNNVVGQYARRALPALQKHLEEAGKIHQQLKETTGGR